MRRPYVRSGRPVIAGMKPYPAYRDSGAPWLEKVPEHWAIERLKSSVTNVIEQTAERQRGDLYIALEHVEGWTGRLRQAGSDVSFDSQVKRFRSGDVLFGKLRPYLAKVTRPTSGGACVGEFLVLRARPSNITAPYVEQFLRSKPVIEAISSSTFGAKMPRADWQFVGGMAVTLPPLSEQAAIVRFLDHADRRIRHYVRTKQKLIKLLEEQKQAIIHRAVTRGLDPNVALKPSDVEWLGPVPGHWVVGRLSQFFTLQRGFDITKNRQKEGGVPVVSSGGVLSYHDCGTAKGPGVLVGRKGTAGSVHYVETDYWAHDTTLWVNDFKGNCPRFIYYVLTMLDLKRFDTGSANPTLNRNLIHPERIAFPPPAEQVRIASMIDSAVEKLVRWTTGAQREISLLHEYRTRLIADVVTGKLDVRAAAAGLPDESEGLELLDEADALSEAEDEPAAELDAVEAAADD
jgi:type I restriction enzyme, S subunit